MKIKATCWTILKNISAAFEITGLLDSTLSCFQLLRRMSRNAGNVCMKLHVHNTDRKK